MNPSLSESLKVAKIGFLTFLVNSLIVAVSEDHYDQGEERTKMVREQLQGRGRDIRSEEVLRAMESVPRHKFVRNEDLKRAYGDHPLPIGHGQTISQPFVVAFMTEQIDPQPGEKILEIGTGSGYQAAILAELEALVFTIEIVEPLAKQSEERLTRLGYENIEVRLGDGFQGWPEKAPFDAIIVTCAPEEIPEALIEQLKEGGRMIIPVGPDGGLQKLIRVAKVDGEIRTTGILDVRFVPMTGGE